MNKHLWLYHEVRYGFSAFFFSILTFSVLDAPWLISFVLQILQSRDSESLLHFAFIMILTVFQSFSVDRL